VLAAHEVEVQVRGGDVGEHGPPGPDEPAFAVADADRDAPGVQDLRGRPAAVDAAAERGEPGDQGRREAARAAFGHREADVLADHREQPPEQAAAGLVGAEAAVHGVAGEEQPGPFAAEALLPEPAGGQHEVAREAERAARAEGPQQA
jgi:hypothetical protein